MKLKIIKKIRLELKLALISAFSKIIIFFILLILLQQIIESQALRHADRDLLKMKDKTMSIVAKIGIKSFLNSEKDSSYASYNMLKDEYISIDLNPEKNAGLTIFSNEARVIENNEFNYRIIQYAFKSDGQYYLLEIGKNMQLIKALNRTLENVSVTIILLLLTITIIFDIGIYKYLLFPLNRKIIPKLKTITNPETYVYSELDSSTSDFVYLNNALNDLMHKVTTILKNQQRFTANVSHELFTPITIMQNKLENLLSSENLSEPMIEKVIDQQNHLNHLQQIIKALLLIARIENDQFVKTDNVKLMEVIDEIIENIEDRAEMKNITIENCIIPDAYVSNVNKSLLYILLFNLISNAIKYNHNGGWIKIISYKEDNQHYIEVKDNGIGIDSSHIHTIFDRFKRIDPLVGEGHGLGLSIVNAIVRFHNGSIEVESVKGIGSTFKVGIPLIFVN